MNCFICVGDDLRIFSDFGKRKNETKTAVKVLEIKPFTAVFVYGILILWKIIGRRIKNLKA
ncbi:MAG: hypothetical protein J6I62_10915 [Selenomonadaceae bacterium]|nr:hypothetical protein [Selenomonadaceae bacterium]